MPFLTKEKFELVPGSENVIVIIPLKYKIPENFHKRGMCGLEVIAPSLFISDLASIPQVFLSVFRKLGKHRRAAVIHDYLYFTGTYKKGLADDIFLAAMKESGVGWFKRYTMYSAVKCGGYFAWKKHRDREKEGD